MKKKVPELIKILIAGLTSTLVFIAFVAALIMAYINLKTYAVYYAEHTPHADNVDPVAIEVLDNLQWNTFPKDSSYGADFDGNNTLYLKEDFSGKWISVMSSFNDEDETYSYKFYFKTKTGWRYTLNANLDVIDGLGPELINKTNFTQDEKDTIKQEARQLLKPIVQVQPKPDRIHLQWLYDMLNHDRFN